MPEPLTRSKRSEPGIEFRRGRHGEGFYLDFTAQSRRIRAWGGRTITEARAELIRLRAQKMFEPACRDSYLKFSEFGRLFIEQYAKPNKESWRRDDISLRVLGRYFGDDRLSDLTAERIERFKAGRSAEVSKSTVNRELACLKTTLSKAVSWGYLRSNVASTVHKFKEPAPRSRILTDAEAGRLIDSAAAHLRPLLVVLLNTGMRRGEALALEWEDIDLDRGFIHISQSKNGRSRDVPLNSPAVAALRPLGPGAGRVFAFNDVKRSFHTATKKAKIAGLRLHDLRHTAASWMVESGVDLATVSKILGHSTIQMTMRYTHPTPENMRRAVEKLAGRMTTCRVTPVFVAGTEAESVS